MSLRALFPRLWRERQAQGSERTDVWEFNGFDPHCGLVRPKQKMYVSLVAL